MWLLIYVILLLIISSIAFGLWMKEVEVAYIYHSGDPGGPGIFMLQDASVFVDGEIICFVLLQWAADGLLVRTPRTRNPLGSLLS